MVLRVYLYFCIFVNNFFWMKVVNYLLVLLFIISVVIRVNMYWLLIMEFYKVFGLIINWISCCYVSYYGYLYNILNEKKLINFIIV